MDAFALRQQILKVYSDYVHSFLKIRDENIRRLVKEKLVEGVLWPEPLVQLNPSYEDAADVGDLVDEGVLHPLCAQVFMDGEGKPFRLYCHQEEALRVAARHEPYVLTTGTGSGKSLTYFIPIVDHVLKHNPERHSVRAIIVYPMNALINSQLEAIGRLADNVPNFPVRFARYTGQENQDRRQELIDDPPHVLLTNYVMLELMLTRTRERVFTNRATAELDFLVMDELHSYGGRQGADVSMLIRRLRERCGNPELLCVGTSATMAAGGSRQEQRHAVADVASKIFGVSVPRDNVIDETLKRVTVPYDTHAGERPNPVLRDSVKMFSEGHAPLSQSIGRGAGGEGLPYDDFIHHPLAVWIEETFGIQEIDGHLRRRLPVTLAQGAKRLAEETETDPETCRRALEAMFRLGSHVTDPDGNPVFAFKLHQFISQGDSVYATPEPPERRHITMVGQTYAPGEGADRPLFPLVFCRECGQEYLTVRLQEREGRIVSTLADLDESEIEDTREGYLLIEDPANPIWGPKREADLPDNWFRQTRAGRNPKREFAPSIPRPFWVRPEGTLSTLPPGTETAGDGEATLSWFIPKPFLTCLNCGVVYTRRDKADFRKLARLSSEGRSTATTLLGLSTVAGLRQQEDVERAARKLLSFTDNRQDASLQAGHFNDFVQVALLRSAVYRALPEDGSALDHRDIAQEVVKALDLPESAYAKSYASNRERGRGRLSRINRRALQALMEYRVYEDLRRGWRVVQPNLEQCGLLHIEYEELDELCRDPGPWQTHPLLASATPETRYQVACAFLDHLRRALAIDASPLGEEAQGQLERDVNDALNENWAFGPNPILRTAGWFVPSGGDRQSGDGSLSERSALGRYLRSSRTWPGLQDTLSADDYRKLLSAWLDILQADGYILVRDEDGAVQLRASSFVWKRGDGTPVEPDPIRSRWMPSAQESDLEREANTFFSRFYAEAAAELGSMSGQAHTGQVSKDDRITREGQFREGELALLFCSPTMELGIDIADLNAVHLRNVPPSPANYAQRSGRAGRSGQPALVTTYCSVHSGHDQYFFRRPVDMVSGVVAPPRLDLTNEELLKAHIHAVWLAKTGLSLQWSIIETLDTAQDGYPLQENAAHNIELPAARLQECFEECRRVLASDEAALTQAQWYSDDWLWQILTNAPRAFNAAFARWREMYAAADRQLQTARQVIDHSYQRRVDRQERQTAERQEREARRQKDILCNQTESRGESDFNPYRYLASEGFLPGYNFPRLPIRAFVSGATREGEFISRPRFLALTEFGPGNIIYHEGRKFRITRSQLPSGNAQERMVRTKLCKVCGAFHEGEEALVDVCEYCGIRLDADNSDFTEKLFEMTDVVTRRTERITCDEEERRREGYRVDSAFRFAYDERNVRHERATVQHAEGHPLFTLTYGPAATLWRINHGWRRAQDTGFTLDMNTGDWVAKPGDNSTPAGGTADIMPDQRLSGVRLMVRDTRNILLLHLAVSEVEEGEPPFAPMESGGEDLVLVDEAHFASLQAALQRGMELVFQVDTGELAAERLGRDEKRGILFWEAAEGGLGILSRLVEEPGLLAEVARAGLEICHFGPDGEDLRPPEDLDEGCVRACYDCLLSYSNQWDHPILDRHLIRDMLLALADARVNRESAGRSYEEHYHWLRERTDPASELERRFLDHLYQTGRRLPDHSQPTLADFAVCPDFYYEDGLVCVFCDGSVHDTPSVREEDRSVREELGDRGYRVVEIRYDRDMEDQVSAYSDVFGEARE